MTDKPDTHLMMITIGMAPNNTITISMLMDGRPLGNMQLDRAAAENIIAGLQTHVGYLKQEKFDA